jgi:hypothetical protein
MFSAAKDKLASHAAKSYVQGLLKSFGRVEDLTIDSGRRRISIRCTLEGEVDAIEMIVRRYELERGADGIFLRVEEFSASRRWLDLAARDHLVGRRFKLPEWAAAAL